MGVESNGEVSIAHGGARACVALLGTVPTTFSQHDVFTAPPSGEAWPRQWHGTFVVPEPSTAAEFVAVRRGGCPATPASAQATATGWEIEVAGRRVTIGTGGATVHAVD
jgi:hypothetical protein